LAILLSILITKRGLGHLKKLTAATEKITVSNLHERIDPTALPQELISLGIAFNQMLARIEASFSALSAFSAELAHEIRTPINNLMGSTEVMLSGNYTVKEYQDELVSNFEELQRIAQILENLLFLARAENGLIDLEKATLNVSDEIKALIAYHQAMADEKEIAMVCYGEAELKANSVMFKRMISNILSNALKYAYNQSKISIEIKKLTQQQTQIIINNQGIGIAAAHLPKLFERFYRIKDSESANKKEGLGLGLAIVKTIVDLHQGNIVIHSQPGQNVSVIITLPG
jgi:two-component system heavy metal sensor histidine kinase CusS